MVDLTPQELQDLWQLNIIKTQQDALKAQADEIRRRMAEKLVPGVLEGAKTVALPDRWKVKVDRKINRTIDHAILNAISDNCLSAGINLKSLVTYKPSLILKPFRELSHNDRAIFGECVTETPGLPTIALIAPPEETT